IDAGARKWRVMVIRTAASSLESAEANSAPWTRAVREAHEKTRHCGGDYSAFSGAPQRARARWLPRLAGLCPSIAVRSLDRDPRIRSRPAAAPVSRGQAEAAEAEAERQPVPAAAAAAGLAASIPRRAAPPEALRQPSRHYAAAGGEPSFRQRRTSDPPQLRDSSTIQHGQSG